MPTPIEQLNDFRQRILKCQKLRAEAQVLRNADNVPAALVKEREADAAEPTTEELRQALIALRAHRGKAVEAAAERKKPKIDPLANLDDLFAPKGVPAK